MNLLDLVFPKKCVNCGKWGSYVCQNCQVGLWEEEQICPVCTRNSRYGLPHKYCHKSYGLDGLTCLWAYEGAARTIIKKAKYRYFYDLLEFLISNFQFTNNYQFSNFQKFLESKPILVPVPLFEKRYRERGFNQAAVAAKLVTRLWGLGSSEPLVRIKDTGHQTNRSREERLKAVAGAFSLKPRTYNLTPNILLVDDVWTTGATMSECCRVLKIAGVKRVWGLVLAR